MVVRQVGAHHDQGLRPAPAALEHRGHLVGGGVAHHQRHQGEVVEDGLEERKLDLEAVLEVVGDVVDRHVGGSRSTARALGVDADETERGREGIGAAHPEPAQRHPVAGPEQHDTPDRRAAGRDPQVRGGGDRPGVHVPGVGHDERLGDRRIDPAVRAAPAKDRAIAARSAPASAG